MTLDPSVPQPTAGAAALNISELHRTLVRGTGGHTLDIGAAPIGFDFSPRAIADAKLRIREALAPFDAIQTLAAIVAFSSFNTPEGYSEPLAAPSGRMEFVAMTLLERDAPDGLRVMTADQTNRAAGATQRALDAAEEVGRNTIFTLLSNGTRPGEPLRRIAAHLQLVDAGVRGPGYEHQAKEILADLFSGPAIEAGLTRTLGFTAAAAIGIETALTTLFENRFNATLKMISLLTNNPQEAAFQIQRRAEYVLCVTADEVRDAAGVDRMTAAAFLDRFSMRFGEVRGVHLLSGLAPIRDRPLIHSPDGRYLSTSAVNLLWALHPALEEALKDEPEWEHYQARRASFVETKVVDALRDAMSADAAHANLRFSIAGGPSYEIDGVVVVDDVAFVIEAKGGRLNRQARRGRLRAVRDALEQLIGRATSQALRLCEAIASHHQIEFTDSSGQRVDVPLERVARVEPVVVTLEDLSWLLSYRQELAEAGLLASPEDLPWVVSVFDFELICRLIEFPAQLTLYLKARRGIPVEITPGDEMNLWMMHLLTKLEFPPDASRISLRGDWTDEVDRHFMFGHGPIPRMPLERRSRKAVIRAQRDRAQGYLDQTEAVISSDQATRLPQPAVVLTRGDQKTNVYARGD